MSDHAGLAAALAAFQGEAPTFTKSKTAKVQTKTGGHYTYRYADLGDILPVVRPLLAKHGLSWSSKPSFADGQLVLRYRLLHASGEADEDAMPLGVDRQARPQEIGSAITYARRYAITAQLNLATEEDEDGQMAQAAERPKVAPVEQVPLSENRLKTMREVFAETGWTASELKLNLSAVGAPNVADVADAMRHLTPQQADELVSAMNAAVDKRTA